MPLHGAGFWAGVTLAALLAAWGAWRLAAPPIHHPTIIIEGTMR